jgi:hypothetical protein
MGLIYKDIDVTTPDSLKIKTWFFPAQKMLSEKEQDIAWDQSDTDIIAAKKYPAGKKLITITIRDDTIRLSLL